MGQRWRVLIGLVFVLGWLWLVSWHEGYNQTYCEHGEQCAEHNLLVYSWLVLTDFAHKFESFFIVLFTAFLAAFTWQLKTATEALNDSTKKLWEAGEKQIAAAQTAADAAVLSARAAIAIEVPIIRIHPGSLGSSSSKSTQGFWIANLTFSNLGKTKAFPIEIQIGFTVGKSLPEFPIYEFSKPLPLNYIFEPDPKITPQISMSEFEFEVSSEVRELIARNELNLWVYCNLVYFDFMQSRHEAGFCWLRHASMGTGTLRSDPTPAYNKKI